MPRAAVVGAGWAGLAAAVHAARVGHAVTLFETAREPGGRARTVERHGEALDNGQHILIGAYVETLELMRIVGVDPAEVLERLPLGLITPDGRGLRLPQGHPGLAFARGVWGHPAWPLPAKAALLWHAARWAAARFRCAAGTTVQALCRGLPALVRAELIEPLCIAALNTPAAEADAQVFLRVLHDALFGAPGSADLLLPRRRLGDLLPRPAVAWLAERGAQVRPGVRVQTLDRSGTGWCVDGEGFDFVVLACTAVEAARLAGPHAPAWADEARNLAYEPIVTVTLEGARDALCSPMVALGGGPAQFAFDHAALGGPPGRVVFALSGARAAVDAGADATGAAVAAQALAQFPGGHWTDAPRVVAVMAERRATFRCTPGLRRPGAEVAPGLAAAGDYVAGPYPATLEGAVRSGKAAVARLVA